MSGIPFDSTLILQRALELQQSGQMEEAARLYREILQRTPQHPRALQFLGRTRGANADGTIPSLALFERAAVVETAQSGAHYNLANLLGTSAVLNKRLLSTIAHLGWHPITSRLGTNRGAILERLNRLTEALESLRSELGDRAAQSNGPLQSRLRVQPHEPA